MLRTVIQQVKGGWELSDKILSLYTYGSVLFQDTLPLEE